MQLKWAETACVCAQLGDGTNTNRNTPPSSDVLTGVAVIAAGYYHTCVLTTAGGVRCWGYNVNGEVRLPCRTCAVLCSCCDRAVLMLCGVHSAFTENCAQCMCVAAVNDDARSAWLTACVLVRTLVSQLSGYSE